MKTFSALLAICAGNSTVTGEFPAQWPVTRSFGVFFICALINGWVNNREVGDLKRHRAHYDVTIMCPIHVSATYMDDFYVVGSNLSFPESLPGPMVGSGYQLCGQYPGTPPVARMSRITCQPQPITARYVYIQVDRSADPKFIELCEVWVYGSKCSLYLSSLCDRKSQEKKPNDYKTRPICFA